MARLKQVLIALDQLANAILADLPELSLDEIKSRLKQQRQLAYTQESDPLFFKAQRNEISLSDWIAKIEEIKARYPYPDETS